eukprot:CAMPEP_0118641988 /NCGR_PEP_ID=MMETSP0785-20121206/5600_1 /TAXON_ID=91992 /ORGANISM="Bolidomonas pacifica, Strain CCMP 1866" /LENGTH=116 /DNA_ID=CAMNT_0006533519 /DNA_START=216 /DNA_END=563 /DNA_ORIENTATION=-
MSDSSDDEPNFIPDGVLRKHKGWAGEEMEVSRHIQSESNTTETPTLKEAFQNKEVGVGYQHHTVMRQKTGLPTLGKVVDMTGGMDRAKRRKTESSSDKQTDPEVLKKKIISSASMR